MKAKITVNGNTVEANVTSVTINGEPAEQDSRYLKMDLPSISVSGPLVITHVGGYPVADADEAMAAIEDTFLAIVRGS